ncbi:peptide transporter [Mycobacterium dioxanotrophicus]|uniref:Peptide transporter n=1 Tax=Mycobacterium dioxanotrophicus TaxID=482462 RepID=A0A1Y0CE30_9MYCO|nr:ParB/RepB/Spo0J family partition protein [Mycobacterium dioxanotrophicus]ART73314.1 peptide transporter [Mycobacterium dioxanotrophicus]
MARGGVKSFESLVDAVGDDSSVDGTAQSSMAPSRSSLSRSVPLRDLVGNPHNPRDSVGDLAELASIAEFQLQPVVAVTRQAFLSLYPDAALTARWVVILGNRRLAAAHKFGRTTLDIVVKDELAVDRGTLLSAIIAENVDRSGFDVIEEAKAVASLVQEFGRADQAADHLRKSKTWVSQRLGLLKLAPDLQQALRRGDLAIREARTLAQVPLEQQVIRWNAGRKGSGGGAGEAEAGAESADDIAGEKAGRDTGAPPMRSLTRAVRNFHDEPGALAAALHDQLGESGTRTLMSHLRKILK